MRESESYADQYLKKYPKSAINLGDGKGLRCGKKYKGFIPDIEKFVFKKTVNKKIKKKKGRTVDMYGFTYKEKVKLIKKLLKKAFDGELPESITFKPVVIRKGKSKASPDGLRLLVHIDSLNTVQNNVDKDGKFGIDRCLNDINK